MKNITGLLIELVISWLVLWFYDKKNLLALGISPTKSRLGNLFFGFSAAAICCAIYYLSITAFSNNGWKLNGGFTGQTFAASFWWTLNSVLFEELIFRGALLYIAVQKFGPKTAGILSAIAFGIYHWFSYGVLGDPVQMISLFFMTFIWGFMFSMAFTGTKSLYLPIGLHFGWNLINTVIFSQGPLGDQLLISGGGQKLSGIISLMVFLFQVFALPLITFWYLRIQAHKQKIPS